MTNKEVRELLLSAKDKEWFENYSFKWNPECLPDYKIEIKGYAEVFQYFSRQARGWAKMESSLPSTLEESKIYFISSLENLEEFLKSNVQKESIYSYPNLDTSDTLLPYDCSEVSFLLEMFNQNSYSFEGAFDFIIRRRIYDDFKDPNYFTGVVSAYEFKQKDSSQILNRRNKEKSSISRLKNDFEQYFVKAESHVNEFLAAFKSAAEEHAKEMDNLKEEKNSLFHEWYTSVTDKEREFNESSHSRIEELEKLYAEKLKLEAPAKYWSDRAKKLNDEGKKWLYALIACCAISVLGLGVVLYFISDGTLKDLFDKTGSAIRWSLVFITFVSFLAYNIRTFAKLTFSAYHLVRDAEEREQLVYVYLALINESKENVDSTERHLIMQSIFSRADTGLLKDDASPTMPGNIVDKFIAK